MPEPAERAPRPLSPIALQRTRHDVLRTALGFARDAWGAGGAFAASNPDAAAVRGTATDRAPVPFPVGARIGLDASCWADVAVRAGRGLGGRVLQDRRPRTSDDYVRDGSITPDYVSIMRQESVHAVAVVPIEDLSARATAGVPAALLYVTSGAVGAPGDRVVTELLRIADMAAVGLVHAVDNGAPSGDETPATPLTAREQELLQLLAAGCSNRQISDDLVIAPSTVKAHLARIYRKLEAPSRLAAVAAGRRRGLV